MNSRNTFEPGSRFEHEDGNTRLEFHLRDCVGGMGDLVPDGSVDLVVTSPPYNLGIAYGKYDDTLERDEYLEWSEEWAGAVRRALKPDGALFLNVGAAPKNPYLPHELVLRHHKSFRPRRPNWHRM